SRLTVTPVCRRSPAVAASSKVCPADASTSHHTAKLPTVVAVIALKLATGRHHTTGRGIPIVLATRQLVSIIRHAPDPTHLAATTHPKAPTRSTTTATATNSHSEPDRSRPSQYVPLETAQLPGTPPAPNPGTNGGVPTRVCP